MAKQEAGYMGGFSGTLGTAVGYSWRGKWVLRSKPGHVSNPRTDKQMQHRELFKRMVQSASNMGAAVIVGLRDESHRVHMTEYNLFVNLNKDCYTLADNELTVDYEHLRLSCGPVAPVAFGEMEIDGNLTGHIDFAKNPQHSNCSSEDVVYVYAYCPDFESITAIGMAPRRAKRVNLCFPSEWAGREVHLYGFVTDVAGRASETEYIGHGPLEEYHPDNEEDSLADEVTATLPWPPADKNAENQAADAMPLADKPPVPKEQEYETLLL